MEFGIGLSILNVLLDADARAHKEEHDKDFGKKINHGGQEGEGGVVRTENGKSEIALQACRQQCQERNP